MAKEPTNNDLNNSINSNGEGIQDIKDILQGQSSNLHSPKDANGNPSRPTTNTNTTKQTTT